ncbi:MAG: transcriptional regulator [Candidatus Micrarchaeota archaeon]
MVLNSLEPIKSAKELDADLLTLPRLQILSALYPLNGEVARYRDLKAGLEMGDGILFFNLKALEKRRYISKKKETDGRRKATEYRITDEGKEAFKKVLLWLKDLTQKIEVI